MTNIKTQYDELVTKYREYSTLARISGLLHWDMQTVMPPKGAALRGEELAVLAGVVHQRLTDPRIGELLSALESASGDLSEERNACVREIARDHRRATKVPQQLIEELNRHQSACHEIWVKSRESGRFADYAPALEKMVDLTAKSAEYLGYDETPMDALIDQFEPDATTAMFTRLFDEVKATTIPLLNRILASPVKANRGFLDRSYPAGLQKEFGEMVMEQIGFDMEAGRLDTAVHPFCSGTLTDVRITTRYSENAPQGSLFGVIHETGHALYEQGLPINHMATPLAEALSYGIHESQSRMWENFIARSRPFWIFFLPKLKKQFAEQLWDVTLDQFVLAVNHVERSFIRTEADEMTYDLHIIIRFEIERDLFAGKIRVMDLPAVWSEKMKSYLGITPPNDGKEGVMQDVHWSGGMFGYFPSYSLGNIAAAQLWQAMRKAIPDMDSQIEQGRFDQILTWLRANVHAHGRRFTRDELLRKATGQPLNTKAYADYLTTKYSALYKL